MDTNALPSATCETCNYKYWACACGDSPLNRVPASQPDPPKPERCTNRYHAVGGPLRLVEARVCCRRYNHNLGSTCAHCGQKD